MKLHSVSSPESQESMVGSTPTEITKLGPKATIKFLCSYGGKIVPRYPDGKLRYLGGQTRVLAVDRFIPFSDLMMKMRELSGMAVSLRCQLPTEDLDALVSITSEEDLANILEEYDRVVSPPASLKIRAFLSPLKSFIRGSPISSSSSSSKSSSSSSSSSLSSSRSPKACCSTSTPRYQAFPAVVDRCLHQISPPVAFPTGAGKNPNNCPLPRYAYHAHGNPGHFYLIHNGNHWQ